MTYVFRHNLDLGLDLVFEFGMEDDIYADLWIFDNKFRICEFLFPTHLWVCGMLGLISLILSPNW